MTTALVVPEKAHATLGASTAARWMACPGSVRLSAGLPNTSSPFALEGTAAHALAEMALRTGLSPATWVGAALEGVKITDEMADAVAVYTDYCERLKRDSTTYWIEARFSLGVFNPPAPMFGTADFVAYDAATCTLHVCDLKYGRGVVVEAAGNKQLSYYALGAAVMLGAGRDIDVVCATIVQPRAAHPDGVIRSDLIRYMDLLNFAAELFVAARATLQADAPLVPGAHCRFCPASGICPAQMQEAQEIARCDFDALPANVPPPPETLPDAVFADMLAKLPLLEDWALAMRAHALSRLNRGEAVPGWKLVAKRPTRKWADTQHVRGFMAASGFARCEYLTETVKSPAQIEQLYGRNKLPSELVVLKESSGTVMVPEHDARPAVPLPAADDFTALLPAPE